MADSRTRQAKRSPVTLKIKFKSATLDQFIERYSVDVSHGGIFIRTKDPLPVGTTMRFEFQLKDASPLIQGEGTVVWTREHDPKRVGVAPGMGVRFDRLTEGSQQILDRILAGKASKGSAKPAFSDTPTRVAPSPLVQDLARESKDNKIGLGSGSFSDERTDSTPLPMPIPFHSDADEFPEEAFEEATKVRSLDDLVAMSARPDASLGDLVSSSQAAQANRDDFDLGPAGNVAASASHHGGPRMPTEPTMPATPSLLTSQNELPSLGVMDPGMDEEEPTMAAVPFSASGPVAAPVFDHPSGPAHTAGGSGAAPLPAPPVVPPAITPPAPSGPAVAPSPPAAGSLQGDSEGDSGSLSASSSSMPIASAAPMPPTGGQLALEPAARKDSAAQVAHVSRTSTDDPGKSGGNRAAILAVIAVLLLGVAGGAYALFFRDGGTTTPPDPDQGAVANDTDSETAERPDTPVDPAPDSTDDGDQGTEETAGGNDDPAVVEASGSPDAGAGAAVAVAMAADAGESASESVEPAPPDVPRVPVLLRTVPAGATAELIDGDQDGATPLTLKIPEDRRSRVRISHPGYVTQEVELDPRKRRPSRVKLAAEPWVLQFSSEPEGARVYVDGRRVPGKTPNELVLTQSMRSKQRLKISMRVSGHEKLDISFLTSELEREGTSMVGVVEGTLVKAKAPVRPRRPRDNGGGDSGSGDGDSGSGDGGDSGGDSSSGSSDGAEGSSGDGDPGSGDGDSQPENLDSPAGGDEGGSGSSDNGGGQSTPDKESDSPEPGSDGAG